MRFYRSKQTNKQNKEKRVAHASGGGKRIGFFKKKQGFFPSQKKMNLTKFI